MVRLRTDRWYSSAGQRRSRSRASQQVGGSRRLLSLCFLLALIILLMQKAADPRHVRDAFQALGVPLDETPTAATVTPSTPNPVAESAWQITCRDLLPRLLDQRTDQELTALAKIWFGGAAARQPSDSAVWPQADELHSALDPLVDLTRASAESDTEQSAWLERLERFRSQWQLLGEQPHRNDLPPGVSGELQSAITAYLDQRLVGSLRDASPWTAEETFPFWRLLQRGQSTDEEAITAKSNPPLPIVNTPQLVSAADTLRGTPVRFRGSVRRVEFIERSYSPLDLNQGYWVLWLRGLDAAIQPVAVYTTHSEADVLARQIGPEAADFPEIEVTAIVAKRLAYAAQAGVEVAPTLFASSLIVLKEPLPAASMISGDELWGQLLTAIVGACLLAAAVMLPFAWRRNRQWWGTRRRMAPGPDSSLPAGDASHKSGRIIAPLVAAVAALPASVLLGTNLLGVPQTPSRDPPWAKQERADPLERVFIETLRQLFEPTSLEALRQYQAERDRSFPDSLLKAAHAIRRVGWQRALNLPEPIPLSDNVHIRPRQLGGWVRLASPVALSDNQQSWFQADEQEQLFRIELQLDNQLFRAAQAVRPAAGSQQVAGNAAEAGQPQFLTIYCQHVPSAWLVASQLRQPAQFTALVFEDTDREEAPWCALARQPEWRLPPAMAAAELTERLAPPLTQQQLELGQLGWDLMHAEAAVARHQQPLATQEADGFYSLIRLVGAAGSAAASASVERGSSEPSQSPLAVLAEARQSLGTDVNWPVRIVSGTLVAVDNPDHRRELGAEAYIQYIGFVDIGRDRVHFQPATTGQQPAARLEFEGEFPITIVSSVKNGLLPEQRLAAGVRSWEIGQFARLQGRFYRMWAYQSEAVKSHGQAARQIAPLVIAARIVPGAPPVRAQASPIGWFGWALSAATLVILGGILWSTAAGLRLRKRLPPRG